MAKWTIVIEDTPLTQPPELSETDLSFLAVTVTFDREPRVSPEEAAETEVTPADDLVSFINTGIQMRSGDRGATVGAIARLLSQALHDTDASPAGRESDTEPVAAGETGTET